MKKSFIFVAALATAVLAISCAKVVEESIETEQPEEEVFEYIFRVSDENSDPTKTTLDGNTVKWESGDKIGVYATGTTNKYGEIKTLNPVQFPVYLSAALSAGDKVYCYYPYNKDDNDLKDADEIKLTIPATQSGDFDAMPQVSLPYEVTSDMASGSNNVDDIYFCNLGSVAQFLVYSSTGAYTGESVESITLDANTALAGSITFDLTSVDYSDPSTLATSGYSSKWAKTTATPAIGTSTSNAGVANLVIAPGIYYGTIQVKTDVAKYTYTITEPNKITFNRSKIKKLALNLESANCERVETHPVGEVFVPATSVANGDVILITNGTSGTISVMGYQKTNNRDAVSYTVDGGAIISTAAMYPLMVKTGTVEDSYFSLYDPDTDGYLYAASNGSNHLKTQTTNDKNSEWEIVLNASSQATTFKATGSTNRNVMQFNSSLFSCYSAASYDAVYVFKKSTETMISAANQNIAYTVTEVEIPYNVYNASGATSVEFNTNPGSCASNLAINEGTKKVTFDITENDGVTRTVKVDITNNGVTKTVSINQAAAPSKLIMSAITAVPGEDQIVFSWDDVDDATGYQVSTDGGSSWGSTQTATSYTWTGRDSFTSYTIKVKAIADHIYHLDSDPGSFTAKTTLALPTSITWTKASKTVTWTDTNTGAGTYGTDYKYQYTIDNGANFTDVESPGNTVTLTITETKTFKIKAIYVTDASLNSALSSGMDCPVGDTHFYSKVTSIESGAKYLIVAHGLSKVLVPSTGSNKKASADVTITDSKISSVPSVDAYAVTITENGTSYDITFKSGNTTYYLVYASSTNLGAETSTTKKWNVNTSVSHGDFGFRDSSTTTRGLIFRAGTTNQFGGYATSNLNGTEYYDVDLYKYE